MSVREVPWPEVAGRIQRKILRPPHVNPHMVLLGQTRSGKDHAGRHGILPTFPLARVVVLITKPVLDLADPDPAWRGYGNLLAGPAELRPGFGRGLDGTPRYVIPMPPGRVSKDDAQRLLDQLLAEGELILWVSDAARLTDPANRGGLGCEANLTHMMAEGAGLGLSVIACANSSAWAAAGIKDQAAAVMIGRAGGDMRDNFADIAGLERRSPARKAIDSLRPHWWLYTDHADGDLRACITTPHPAGTADESWPWSLDVEAADPEIAQRAELIAKRIAQLRSLK